jgi:pimeloyl-ACP methyl ester carboxylesterase
MQLLKGAKHRSGILMERVCAAVIIILCLSPFVLSEEAPIVTQQQAEIGHKILKYTVEVGRIAICDVETGEPRGYMFYTAYRMPSSRDPRPVTFVWNGGPGANSSLLHFSVVGPKRVEGSHLLDNPDSWLPATDLVLVDPIGTGFSRPVRAEYGAEFYSTVGDVASVTEFVRAWRLVHNSGDTAVFLAGESWGAGRAASVAYRLEKRGITVHGLILISGGWGLNKSYGPAELRAAIQIVDMASTALYYGKTAPDLGKDPMEVRQAAGTWVHESYAPALRRLETLSEAERTAIVTQLSRFTGLAQGQIDRKTLAITPRQFRTGLLKDQGKEPYIFDMRRTAPPANGEAPVILRYFRQDLGYHTSLPYFGLESIDQGFAPTGTYPDPVNARWNYATAKVTSEEWKAAMEAASTRGDGPPHLGPPLPATEEALVLNPRMKVLVAAGMYDSFLPCAVGTDLHRQLPLNLQQSITFKCYIGGHAMYEDASTRTEFSRDVKALIHANR